MKDFWDEAGVGMGQAQERVQERTLEFLVIRDEAWKEKQKASQEGKQLDLKHLSNTVTEPQQRIQGVSNALER